MNAPPPIDPPPQSRPRAPEPLPAFADVVVPRRLANAFTYVIPDRLRGCLYVGRRNLELFQLRSQSLRHEQGQQTIGRRNAFRLRRNFVGHAGIP